MAGRDIGGLQRSLAIGGLVAVAAATNVSTTTDYGIIEIQSYDVTASAQSDKLLDNYTGAAAAYAVRKLRANYTGPCIEVRRGDGQLQDIGFDANGNLDTAAIKSFCDADTGGTPTVGTVRTWYDQSANGNDATQSTTSAQPQIYDGSAVLTENGKPAIQWTSSHTLQTAATLPAADLNAYSATIVFSGGNGFQVPAKVIQGSTYVYPVEINSSQYWVRWGGASARTSLVSTDGAQHIVEVYGRNSSLTSYAYFDGSQNSITNSNSAVAVNHSIILGNGGGSAFIGKLQEHIIWHADMYADQSGISSDINTYYDVYGYTLNNYPGAAGAYSVRKLRAGYTGPCMKVRRDDGVDTGIDIGFDANGNLNTAAIAAHCSTDNGYVVTWYDQSGNGNHVTQGTTTRQPQIFNGTAVLTENGKPCIKPTSNLQRLIKTSASSSWANGSWVFGVHSRPTHFACWVAGGNSTNNFFLCSQQNNTQDHSDDSNIDASYVLYQNGASWGAATRGDVYNDMASQSLIVGTANFSSWGSTITIGLEAYNYSIFNSQEVIIYHSDQSANRTDIESDINTYFSIYSPVNVQLTDSGTLELQSYDATATTTTSVSASTDFVIVELDSYDVSATASGSGNASVSLTEYGIVRIIPLQSKKARLGTNTSGIDDYAPDISFRDVFKKGRTWISQVSGGAWGSGPALDINSEGTITTLGTNSGNLLNTYSGAAAAYSVRKLSSTYSGPAIRIREDGGDTETDIGFDSNGRLDTAAIEAWCGTNNGFVVIWYDQSGNNRNATAAADTDEPQIYDGTAVITKNGKPAIEFDGLANHMNMPDSMLPANINNCSVFTLQTNESNSNGATFNLGGYGGNDRWFQTIVASGTEYFGYGSSFSAITIGSPTTAQRLITAIAGSTQGNAQCFVDGTSQGSVALASATPSSGSGELVRSSFLANGTFQEVVVYHNDQSGNRTNIEDDINAYFRPTVAGYFATCLINREWDTNPPGTNKPNPIYPTGDYTLIFEGTGTIRFRGDGSGTYSTPGTYTVSISNATDIGIWLEITDTDPTDPIRNIRFLLPGYTSADTSFDPSDGKRIFTDEYLEFFRGQACVRLMDWQATNTTQVENWSERTSWRAQQTYESGIAPELLVAAVNEVYNEVGVDTFWICIPHKATNSYITSFATLLRDGLNSNIKFYLEYSNETWNGIFPVFDYALAQATALGGLGATSDFQSILFFTAKRAVEAFNIFETVFGDTSRFYRTLASQNGNPWTGTQVMEYDVVNNNGTTSTYANKAAAKADFYSIAPYFAGRLGNSNFHPNLATYTFEDLYREAIPLIELERTLVRDNLSNATANSLGIVCYEAGQHMSPVQAAFQNNQTIVDLLTTFQFTDYMYLLYSDYLQMWEEESNGSLMVHFTNIPTAYGRFGSWGMQNFMDETLNYYPKREALYRFRDLTEGTPTALTVTAVTQVDISDHAQLDVVAYDATASTPVAGNKLLDVYTGAAAAYSVRKLRSNYTGPCLTVRRSQGTAPNTQDIGFDSNGDLDVAAIKSFCDAGGSNTLGYVTTWYDQSGSGRHLSQTGDDAKQPQIYDGTAVITANGKPALDPRSGAARLYSATTTISPTMTIMLVKSGHGGAFGAPLWYATGNATLVWDRNSVGAPGPYYGISTAIHYATPPTDAIYTMKYGSDSATRSNGSQVATTTGNTVSNMSRVVLGGRYEAATGAWSGKAHELIIWDVDHYSTAAAELESNANTYFSIYATGTPASSTTDSAALEVSAFNPTASPESNVTVLTDFAVITFNGYDVTASPVAANVALSEFGILDIVPHTPTVQTSGGGGSDLTTQEIIDEVLAEITPDINLLKDQMSIILQDLLRKVSIDQLSKITNNWNQQFDKAEHKVCDNTSSLNDLQILYSNLQLEIDESISGAVSGILSGDYVTPDQFSGHTGDYNNPHQVTTSQIGAATSSEVTAISGTVDFVLDGFTGHSGETGIHYEQSEISISTGQIYDFASYAESVQSGADQRDEDFNTAISGVSTTLTSHISNYNNPHQVTPAQIGAATTGDLDTFSLAFNSHTANSGIHYTQSEISIDTSQLTDFDASDFTGHTGETGVHFTVDQISLPVSQLQAAATSGYILTTDGTTASWQTGASEGYRNRYITNAQTRLDSDSTVEVYYTARPDGDGYVESEITTSTPTGFIVERKLYFSDKFDADPNTASDWTLYTTQPADNTAFATAKASLLEGLSDTDGTANTRGTLPVSLKMTHRFSQDLLLEDFPGAAAAYSLRRISSDYTGSAIRIREDGTNTETDIGFDADGNLDTNAIALFCTTNNGYVVIWYDQSGNGVNQTQNITSRQPKIYNGSATITKNGRPAIDFAGDSIFLNYATSTLNLGTNDHLVAGVVEVGTTADSAQVWFEEENGSSARYVLWWDINNTLHLYHNTNIGSGYASTRGQQYLLTAERVGTSSKLYIDGSLGPNGTAADFTSSGNDLKIGINVNQTANQSWDGTMQEIIVWPSDQSANRTDIESDIDTYYAIGKPDGPLNVLTDADTPAAGYSLRKLTKFYYGPCIRIRRGNDNQETDIGFDSNDELNTADIISFCGANKGYVITWYDQSGGGNNISQAAVGNQPEIYDGSNVYTSNSKPAVAFDQSSLPYLYTSVFTTSTTASISVVCQHAVDTSIHGVFANGTGNGHALRIEGNTDYYNWMYVGRSTYFASAGSAVADTQTFLFGRTISGSSHDLWKNGTSILSTTSVTNLTTSGLFWIGTGGNSSTPIDGRVQEFILWDTDQSANRNKVEENTAAYFGITLPYLLNNYPGASAAYSLRKINDAYTGPAIRIREDGGNTETNIGFDSNGELNTADIASWCGSNNGYVVTWYDQSGSSNDVTEATTTRQPLIYNGTAVITRNAKPAVYFFPVVSGNGTGLGGVTLSVTNRKRTIFSVQSLELTGSSGFAHVLGAGMLSRYEYYPSAGGFGLYTQNYRAGGRVDVANYVAETVGAQILKVDVANTTNAQIYKNGTQLASVTDIAGNWSYSQWGLGAMPNFPANASGSTLAEVVLYESDQSANRSGIETDILDHYKTTKPDGPFDLVSDTPAAGYSVRKLTKFYEGSCLRIRRDNDNEELDIGFDSNDELKIADISSFCGANNGFVVTWYDQSGNGNDLTQSDPAHQAKIYDGTTILTRNGKPCIRPNDGTDTYTASGLSISQGDLTAFAVATDTYNGTAVLFGESTSHWYLVSDDNDFNNQYGISSIGPENIIYYIDGEEQTWYSYDRDAVHQSLFGQQRLIGIYNNNGSSLNTLLLGYNSSSVAHYEMQELILYNSDQTANRNLINNNTAAYFGITLPQLLNNYSGAEAAYSLRRLSSSYTGAAIRIREDIGDTETDIGFDSNGDLDAAAIKSFCDAVGGANGYVVTWYDQSGNGQDATQSVAADQPQIYDGTAVIQSNGRPAIQFDGSTDGLEFSLSNAPTIVSLVLETSDDLFIPIGNSAFSPQSYLLIGQQGSTSTGWSTWRSASGNFVYVNSTTALSEGQTRGDVYNAISTGNQTLVFVEVDTAPTGTIQLGQWQQSAQHDYNGKMSEVVLWQTDHSTNRTVIEANAITYYGIGIDDGPLDIVTDSNAAAAYSVRKVTKFYNGPSLRVRRASDNYESNIGFDSNGDLDTAAIASFCSTSNGFVVAWYDQSGNKRHATQNSTVGQPQIYNGTSTLTENGQSALVFDGVYSNMLLPNAVQPANFNSVSTFTVSAPINDGSGHIGLILSNHVNNSYYYQTYITTGGDEIWNYCSGSNINTGAAQYRQKLVSGIAGSTQGNAQVFFDGVSQGSTALVSQAPNPGVAGISTLTSYRWKGTFQEVIVYHSDQSSNRIDLEENTARYFGITLPYLLSNYPGAAAVYSLRKLNVRYTGPAIRIREGGGGTVTDIGFDSNGNLNTADIVSFCGLNNGFVVTWYDQSGNNRNATAPGNTNEPKIYDGGTGVHTTNGKPAIQYDGTSDSLDLPNAALPANINSCSAFTVQANTTGFGLTLGTSSNGVRWYQTYVASGTEYFGYAGSATAINLGTASLTQKLITAIAGSTQGNAQAFVDGVSKGTYTLTSGVPLAGEGHIGYGNPQFVTGDFQEVIIYHSDQSTNRTGIESDISAYWTANKLLLDSYPGASAVYSLRKLDNDYNGNCIRIRRSSDNTEQDIGFNSNGELDTAAIEAFCTTSNGYVVTWYDQSGNGQNVTQATASSQPHIYDGTAVLTDNGRPCVEFDGSDDLLTTTNTAFSGTSQSMFIVNKADATSGNPNRAMVSIGPLAGYKMRILTHGPGIKFEVINNSVDWAGSPGSQNLLALIPDGGATTVLDYDLYQDGALLTPTATNQTQNLASCAGGLIKLGYNFPSTPGNASYHFDGKLQEVILYNSDQSSNRTGVESIIDTYYKPTTALLLDIYSGAAAAYSVRKLSQWYTGSCMRIRRDSDDAETDIGFDSGGNLNIADISSFCTTANGYVVTWYDQSGNGLDATATADEFEPRIYDGTAVVTGGTRPALDAANTEGTYGRLDISIPSQWAPQPFTTFTVKHGNATSLAQAFWWATSGSGPLLREFASPPAIQLLGTTALTHSATQPTYALYSTLSNSTSSIIRTNGSQVASGNSGTQALSGLLALFSRPGSSEGRYLGKLQEVIFFDSDQSANFSGIESNTNAYFSIYP